MAVQPWGPPPRSLLPGKDRSRFLEDARLSLRMGLLFVFLLCSLFFSVSETPPFAPNPVVRRPHPAPGRAGGRGAAPFRGGGRRGGGRNPGRGRRYATLRL